MGVVVKIGKTPKWVALANGKTDYKMCGFLVGSFLTHTQMYYFFCDTVHLLRASLGGCTWDKLASASQGAASLGEVGFLLKLQEETSMGPRRVPNPRNHNQYQISVASVLLDCLDQLARRQHIARWSRSLF